jgi:uncharacterized MAPEG superfamily protein
MPATMPDLPIELTLLAWSVILLLVYVMTQAQLANKDRGLAWNAGARDGEPKPLSPMAARAERALLNFRETYPAFVAAVLIAVVAGRTGAWSQAGVWLWFLGRIVYLPLYLFGVPYIRTLAWGVSLVGILLVLFQIA